MSTIDNLAQGFKNFQTRYYRKNSTERLLFEQLVKEGQKPQALIICCVDSRADPAILFDAQPGDIYVVRNVANLAPSYQANRFYDATSAGVEFAVRQLGVKDIIVLGHSHCGGINALCQERHGKKIESDFLNQWLDIARPLNAQISENRALEQASIVNSLNNLRTFPWIASAEQQKKLALNGLWFDMDEGALWQATEQKTEDSATVKFQKLV